MYFYNRQIAYQRENDPNYYWIGNPKPPVYNPHQVKFFNSLLTNLPDEGFNHTIGKQFASGRDGNVTRL